jgi:hypothetical protein
MNRFREELKVIPRAAWVVAWLVYGAGFVALMCAFLFSNDAGMRSTPFAGKVAITFLAPLVLLALIALDGYVYGDAKRRGMRHVMWTLLAIFVPDGIGIILYFILRDPMPKRCATCGEWVLSKFVFCPHCGASAQPTCPQCGHAVEPTWTNCPYCGVKLPRQTAHAA